MFRRNWQALIKPNKFDLRTNKNRTTVVIEPLERGFGFTLGHALRRVLLSSLSGAAITSIRIEDGPRAFLPADGRLSATIDLVLSIKDIGIRMDAEASPSRLTIRKRGPATVVAGDIQGCGVIEILNPEHRICSLEPGRELSLDLNVACGKGYQPAKPLALADCIGSGPIPIDALYSPVRHVSIAVESTRLGHALDYDSLTLTVMTNGAISGEDAIVEAARILHDQLSIFINFEEVEPPPEPQPSEPSFDPAFLRRIDDFELSVRSTNCMTRENIVYLGDLVTMNEAQLLRAPNFGLKSLNEIKSFLAELGLHLGMEIPRWPPPNIEELANRYAERGAWR